MKIATPISSLFNKNQKLNYVSKYSDCFELREHSPKFKSNKKHLYHFDIDLIHYWSKKLKKNILNEIESNKKLKIISFQATSCYQKPLIKNKIYYANGKKISKIKMIENAKNNVEWLKKKIKKHISIALENNNFYNTDAYLTVTDPKFLSEIIIKNNIFLLLDIAHAKITSINNNLNFEDYLYNLPLSKVIQVHLCRHQIKNGVAIDSHFKPSLSNIQFTLELLNKFKNIKYITIEYYKNIDNLIDVLRYFKSFKNN